VKSGEKDEGEGGGRRTRRDGGWDNEVDGNTHGEDGRWERRR